VLLSRFTKGHELHRRAWPTWIAICLTLVTLWPAAAKAAETSQVLPRDDNQIWFDGQFTLPLSQNVDVVGSGGLRLGRGLDHLVFERPGVAVVFQVLSFLNIAPSYNYVASQPIAGKDVREQRFAVDGTLARRLFGFEISDHNRFERRVMPTIAYFRYMNRFLVQHPLQIERHRISLLISDEIFHDGALGTWSRNRFSVGFEKQVSKNISLEFYYLRQNDHYCTPGDIHAFGINFISKSSRKHS
jgi:hypothetical protein